MTAIPIFFPQIYQAFAISAYMSQAAMQIILLLSIIVAGFRLIICMGYQGIYTAYKGQSKNIDDKADIDKIKYGFFSKVIKVYQPILEKGVNYISSRDIVERELSKKTFFFLNYRSMDYIIKTFEASLLYIGGIMAIALPTDNAATALLSITLFTVVKLFAMFFDYKTLKDKIVLDMSNFIDVEIGQHYAKDTVSAINLLRIEIKKAMQEQSSLFGKAIEKFCADMSKTMEKSIAVLADNAEKTTKDVMASVSALNGPLERWKDILAEAAKKQESFNNTLAGIDKIVGNIGNISKISDAGFRSLSEKMGGYFSDMSKQVDSLIESTKELKEYNSNYSAGNDDIRRQIEYIKTNQQTLEMSLQQYELTLREVSGGLADGMGRIIDFHTQQSYNAANEKLQESIKQIVNANNELMARLQSLFEQMREQSKNEMNAIVSIKEQMDGSRN